MPDETQPVPAPPARHAMLPTEARDVALWLTHRQAADAEGNAVVMRAMQRLGLANPPSGAMDTCEWVERVTG